MEKNPRATRRLIHIVQKEMKRKERLNSLRVKMSLATTPRGSDLWAALIFQNAWRRYSEAFLSDTISIEGKGQTPAMRLLEQQGQLAVQQTMQRLHARAASKQPSPAKCEPNGQDPPQRDFIEMDFSTTASESSDIGKGEEGGADEGEGGSGADGSLTSSGDHFEDALCAAEERVMQFVRSEFDELRKSFATRHPPPSRSR